MKAFLRKKIMDPVRAQLTQGIDPVSLSRTVAAGLVISLFPALGVTTGLCVLVGVKYRLNQPILQAINYLLYPVQILMLPVFFSLGAWITGTESVSLNPATILTELKTDPGLFVANYGWGGLKAILAWLLTAPLVYAILSRIRIPIRILGKQNS